MGKNFKNLSVLTMPMVLMNAIAQLIYHNLLFLPFRPMCLCITAVVERRPKDQVSQSVALSLRTSIEAEIFNGQLIPLFFESSINIVAAQASLHHDFDYRDT